MWGEAGGGCCCCSPQGARAAHTAEVRGAREGGSGGADWPARVRERAPLPRAATSRRRRRCAALRCSAACFAPPSPRSVRGGGVAPLRRRQRQRSGGPEGRARRARRMIAENRRPISRGWSGGASAAPPPAGGASASGAPPLERSDRAFLARGCARSHMGCRARRRRARGTRVVPTVRERVMWLAIVLRWRDGCAPRRPGTAASARPASRSPPTTRSLAHAHRFSHARAKPTPSRRARAARSR